MSRQVAGGARIVGRRTVLSGAAAALWTGGLSGCIPQLETSRPPPHLTPIRARVDRITSITVCTRPFRPQGPRLEVETIGDKQVVHNYGHGGSGWSLSWGSSTLAVQMALAGGARDVGVIGAGALGLTSALLLQRAGVAVTLYAKDLPPNVRSSLATGVWSPDSRICFADQATPAFKRRWETMARTSFQTYQTLMGLPGNPVEWIDVFSVSDEPFGQRRRPPPEPGRPEFARLDQELTNDLGTVSEDFLPGSHSLGERYLRRNSEMMFNLPAYSRLLLDEFHASGGRISVVEFHSPRDFAALPQTTLINATGYGAKALFGDDSLVPVRGQLAHVIPDETVRYAINYHRVGFVPRRDGLIFQAVGENDYYGYGDDTAIPDRAEAEGAVKTIAALFV